MAFFNGIHVDLEDTLKSPELEFSPYKLWNDWTDKEELIVIPEGKHWLKRLSFSDPHLSIYVPCEQCDHIGLFLKDLGYKFAYKSRPTIWRLFGSF